MILCQLNCPRCGETWHTLRLRAAPETCPRCGETVNCTSAQAAPPEWATRTALALGVSLQSRESPDVAGGWTWAADDRSGSGFETPEDSARDAVTTLYPEPQWREALASGETLEDYEGWILEKSGLDREVP